MKKREQKLDVIEQPDKPDKPKSEKKQKTEVKPEPPKPDKVAVETQRLEEELKKIQMGSENIFEETAETPDQYKRFPYIVVCDVNPSRFIYPVLLSLENSNVVRLHAISKYTSTVLRVQELFSWCMDIRLKRKRFVTSDSGKRLIVTEYILEKIPACRG